MVPVGWVGRILGFGSSRYGSHSVPWSSANSCLQCRNSETPYISLWSCAVYQVNGISRNIKFYFLTHTINSSVCSFWGYVDLHELGWELCSLEIHTLLLNPSINCGGSVVQLSVCLGYEVRPPGDIEITLHSAHFGGCVDLHELGWKLIH